MTNSPWSPGVAPLAVVMISLNEGHNLEAVLANLKGFAQEVFLVDSFSRDDTVDIALRHGVHVVQRRFRGFGDQWNFALRELPITAPYTMKLDPDERLSDPLKSSILKAIQAGGWDGLSMLRRLWFMGQPLPRREPILRVWRTGACRFSDVAVNEHPVVGGVVHSIDGDLEHLDSPDLDHWLEKQNRYSTAEAISFYVGQELTAKPKLFGNTMERRMWLKQAARSLPFSYTLMFFYIYILRGTWRAGRVGYMAASLNAIHWRIMWYKLQEIKLTGKLPAKRVYGPGFPDPRVAQSPDNSSSV
jgi:glycosyltransferase involved in cell wall biosynthesis